MLHKNIQASERHAPHSFEYADSAARLAATGFTATDIGKLAWQKDNDTFWVLVSYSPTTWISLNKINSVFGRTGDVVASSGDYTASQITFAPAGNISSTNVQNAIAELDTEKAALSHLHAINDVNGLPTEIANFQAHIASTANPHATTAAQVGAVAANPPITAGTATKVTYDAKGLVVSGGSLSASDIPNLDASKITSGTIDPARLPSVADDVIEFANIAAFPATGETGKIYIAADTNNIYRWNGSSYTLISPNAVESVAGKTGVVTLVADDISDATTSGKTILKSSGLNWSDTSKSLGIGVTATNLIGASGALTVGSTTSNGYGALEIQGNRTTADQAVGALRYYQDTNAIAAISGVRGNTVNSGYLSFFVSNSGSLTERLRIDPTGNINVIGTLTETDVPVVTQADIGTSANKIPLNQYLGGLAYIDADNVTITGGSLRNVSVNATNVAAETITETNSPVVTQADIGTSANKIPLNQHLGGLAYMDANNVTVGKLNGASISATTVAAGTVTEADSPVITQADIGVGANKIPMNQHLGGLAYMDANNVTIVGGSLSKVTINATTISTTGAVGVGLAPATRNNTSLQVVDGIGFPATQVASSDTNTLDDYREATYTAVATGMATSPTDVVSFVKVGNMVTLNIPTISGASNSTSFSLTGVPTVIRPSADRNVIIIVQDNGVIQVGRATIKTDGEIAFAKSVDGASFTASGIKGVVSCNVSYII